VQGALWTVHRCRTVPRLTWRPDLPPVVVVVDR